MRVGWLACLFALCLAQCALGPPPAETAPPPALPPSEPQAPAAAEIRCSEPLSVRFYDVGQALAALVQLPDNRNILIDAGEDPRRAGCGAVCQEWHDHLLGQLRTDLGGSPLGMLWITHPHSDHLGGAAGVLSGLRPEVYVDNGLDLGANAVVKARGTCDELGIRIHTVDPESSSVPFRAPDNVKLTPIVPSAWHPSCRRNPNNCSIGLRIDYCKSSLLFTGDAEAQEEELLDPGGEVTLLQVAHHGSDTSSSAAFLAKAKPKYALISSGKPGVGTNKSYCHPRASTVARLTSALGGAGGKTLRAFDERASCRQAKRENWVEVPASDRLWATARDGDVVLTTRGDGAFVRE